MSVARVHVRAWQIGYRHLLPDTYLAQLRPEERAERYDFATRDTRRPLTLVAESGGAIRGFATTAPARDGELPDHGELCALYVDPDYWNHGVGSMLIAAARQRLAEQGYGHAVLWLLAGNGRAERFYRADGWMADGTARQDHIWGITVDELRYRRPLRA